MKFWSKYNKNNDFSFPQNLRKWVENSEEGLSPHFKIDLESEMFIFLDCVINRKEKIALLGYNEYPIKEGDRGFVIRDAENIYDEEEEINFKPFYKNKEGIFHKKHNLIEMDKAILTVEYIVKKSSFPSNVKIERWWDINKS